MKKMLFIEDDDLTVSLMSRLFKKSFKIFTCNSSEEFYKKCINNNYDIIIMDVSLRGNKDGLVLTKEIKNIPSFAAVPILCLTAHAQASMRQTAIDSGIDLFMTKPVQNNVLKDAVEFLLKPA